VLERHEDKISQAAVGSEVIQKAAEPRTPAQ
jgi:hypothetical protein